MLYCVISLLLVSLVLSSDETKTPGMTAVKPEAGSTEQYLADNEEMSIDLDLSAILDGQGFGHSASLGDNAGGFGFPQVPFNDNSASSTLAMVTIAVEVKPEPVTCTKKPEVEQHVHRCPNVKSHGQTEKNMTWCLVQHNGSHKTALLLGPLTQMAKTFVAKFGLPFRLPGQLKETLHCLHRYLKDGLSAADLCQASHGNFDDAESEKLENLVNQLQQDLVDGTGAVGVPADVKACAQYDPVAGLMCLVDSLAVDVESNQGNWNDDDEDEEG